MSTAKERRKYCESFILKQTLDWRIHERTSVIDYGRGKFSKIGLSENANVKWMMMTTAYKFMHISVIVN